METEDKRRERFLRVAVGRTNKIIEMVRLLGNCSNKSNYEYTKKDIDKIFNAIQVELDLAKGRYKNSDLDRKDSHFTL